MSATLTSNASSSLTSSHSYDDALDTFALNTNTTTTTTTNNLMAKSISSSSTSAATSSASSPVNELPSNCLSSNKVNKNLRKENHSSPGGGGDHMMSSSLTCLLCNNKLVEPKLLNCLHSYCYKCLALKATNECGDMLPLAINCPKCKQETIIPNGIDSLESDYVMQNILDMIAIEEMILDCTSCKTGDKAVARCADCASLLCPNCVTAHHFMRLFENHKVVKFEEIIRSFKQMNESNQIKVKERHASYCTSSSSSTCSNSSNEFLNDATPTNNTSSATSTSHEITLNGLPIHKPLFCRSHTKESFKFFCNTCQVPICTDCILSTHNTPAHQYERLMEAGVKNVEELDSLVLKIKDKIGECQSEFQLLDQCLTDLDDQREQAKGCIEETFQSYKQLLEKRKEELFKELDEKHSLKELALMDLNHSIHGSIDKMCEVIKFVERILKNGNCLEISLLKHLIVNQISFLFNSVALTENVDVNLKFSTDEKRFEKAIRETFGRFLTQKEIRSNYFNNLTSSTSQNESLMLAGKLSGEQQRLQLIQKQIEHQQQQQQQANLIKPSVSNNLDQEWFLNMMNNQFSKQISNGFNHFETPNDLQQSPNDNWLKQQQSQQNQQKAIFEQKQRISMSPESIASSTSWFNSSQAKSQFQLNNANTFVPKQPIRPTTPLGLDQNLLLNNNGTTTNNTIQQHQLFLQQQQHLSNSRCQTPGQQLIFPPKHNQMQSDLAAVTNALNMNSIQNICLPNNNQLVVNALDEYMPFGSTSSTMAQNFNQLSKFITSQQMPHSQDIQNLNVNLNELQLGGTSNLNGFHNQQISDINSNSSQSPTQVTRHSVNQFSGNGNLNPPVRQTGKMKNMTIRLKFGLLGAGRSQFNSPHGFCLGVDEEIIVADTNNHRIQVFDKSGEFKYCFGSPGREEGQLWYPRKVIVMRDSGKIVVCDRGNERSRMQIFNRSGHFIKKIAIRYIDIVAGLAITQQGEIVAVDSVSPTVFRISEAGDLIKWFDCSDYMREPSDIAINGNEYYVCDFKGHCVAVFSDEGTYLRKIGGENITNFPNGIEVSDEGDVLVGDSHGNRFHVAVFSRTGDLLSEFECPYVKVSRCCGLKITSEGHVVTLAKNNHHVLVLNTLYVQ